MPVHYFHCTDGCDLVVDKTGRTIGKRQDIEAVARRIARDLIEAVPTFDEWDSWAVHVYDEQRQVGIVPFDVAARLPQRRPVKRPPAKRAPEKGAPAKRASTKQRLPQAA